MSRCKKRILAGVILLLIAGCCIWFHQIDSLKRDYGESMKKAEQDFRLFIELSENLIDGEMISFDDYTEHYMQLRVRISDWNHLYYQLYQTKWFSRSKADIDTSIGEFFIDLERFYFSMIHVCYMKEQKLDEVTLQADILSLEEAMKMIIEASMM